MRQWVKSDTRTCAYCGHLIPKGAAMQVLQLPNVRALFYYCGEHAKGPVPPELPEHIETSEQGRINVDFSRFEKSTWVDGRALAAGEREPGADD